MTKRCPQCNSWLNLSMFNKNRHNRDGLQTYCRICQRKVEIEYRDTPRHKKTVNKRNRKHRTGWTHAQYESALIKQDGRCDICNVQFSNMQSEPMCDHNNRTGETRGLLCMLCNHALERLESILDWGDKAQDYLDKFNG